MLKRIIFAIFTLLLALFGVWRLSGMRTFQLFGDIVARVPVSERLVALTFDDGPTPGYTETVLGILSEHDVKATFFLTGRETMTHAEQAKLIIEAGHEVGNHSYRHHRMVLFSVSRVREEIERTDAALRSAGYSGPIHFRPPYGKKLISLPWYLSRHDRKTIMWDLAPESDVGVQRDARSMADYVLENVRPGSIVLMHVMFESRRSSMESIPMIVGGLKERGYRLVTVSELLAAGGDRP